MATQSFQKGPHHTLQRATRQLHYKILFPRGRTSQKQNIAEGWTVTDLQANNPNRTTVEQTINSVKPDFIIHYDHGSNFTLYDQNNNITEVIDSEK